MLLVFLYSKNIEYDSFACLEIVRQLNCQGDIVLKDFRKSTWKNSEESSSFHLLIAYI